MSARPGMELAIEHNKKVVAAIAEKRVSIVFEDFSGSDFTCYGNSSQVWDLLGYSRGINGSETLKVLQEVLREGHNGDISLQTLLHGVNSVPVGFNDLDVLVSNNKLAPYVQN